MQNKYEILLDKPHARAIEKNVHLQQLLFIFKLLLLLLLLFACMFFFSYFIRDNQMQLQYESLFLTPEFNLF